MGLRRILLPCLLLTGCVAYREAAVSLAATEAEVDRRAVGPLGFAAAVAYARAHNPNLLRLAAAARAAGLDIPAASVGAGANTQEDKVQVQFDPLALASIGPRGAAARVAHQRRIETLAALREEERRVAAAIGECFLVERVLRARRAPAIDVDPEPFAQAGLASDVDRARVVHARRAERAERGEIAAARETNLARLRRLLGLGAGPLELVLPEGEFPPLPEESRERLIARPDLAVALAQYQTADALFRLAVVEQYPTVEIGSQIKWNGAGVGGLVSVRIPIGASKRARAAGERREAARLAVEAALLAAREEAASRSAALQAAEARWSAAAAGADAASAALAAAKTRLETEPDAFAHVADTAGTAVRRATEERRAAVAFARARVACASAYAWPTEEEMTWPK